MINNIVHNLIHGEICILPSDTLYGLATVAYRADYVEKIFILKNRDSVKPMPVHYYNFKQIFEDFELNEKNKRFLQIIWPGGVTVILKPKKDSRISYLSSTVGVRIPDHKVLLSIIKQTGPLIMTSANLSNKENFVKFIDIYNIFKLKGIQDDESIANIPSTVIDLTKNELGLIRNGLVSFEYLLRQYSKC